MAKFIGLTSRSGNAVYVNPESVVLITHQYQNGKKVDGESCVFQAGSDDPLIVRGCPGDIAMNLELPDD